MVFRQAVMRDLPQIQSVFREIVQKMNSERIQIWDDVYPCAFFEADIRDNRLYVLLDGDVVVSAFALCETNPGEGAIGWQDDHGSALYLDHFGVNAHYTRRGIGSFMLERAKETARALGVDYLRLFVVDVNEPAIRLYVRNGFVRGQGVFDEVIEEGLAFREYGFEAAL